MLSQELIDDDVYPGVTQFHNRRIDGMASKKAEARQKPKRSHSSSRLGRKLKDGLAPQPASQTDLNQAAAHGLVNDLPVLGSDGANSLGLVPGQPPLSPLAEDADAGMRATVRDVEADGISLPFAIRFAVLCEDHITAIRNLTDEYVQHIRGAYQR